MLSLLDVGLYAALCGLDATTLVGGAGDPILINSGQLAEQLVGQEPHAWREGRLDDTLDNQMLYHRAALSPGAAAVGLGGDARRHFSHHRAADRA